LVRIEPGGDRRELHVCDSGGPIPPEDVDRIFKPFERGRGPEHPKSVGLGLAVARRLARLMDGDLTYRRAEGMTRFVLSLPSA
jgi:signal transduction histidine kinase